MRAFERMTGNQIAKINQTNQAAYDRTEVEAAPSDRLKSVITWVNILLIMFSSSTVMR